MYIRRTLQVKSMRNIFTAVLLVTCTFSVTVMGQSSVPVPVFTDNLHWLSPPNVSGLQVAWILGSEQKPGTYILRVKLVHGTRIPPHTHPDERNTTVLSGTIYVGFGKTFNETKVVAIPTGAVYVVPANVPHYIWAKDGNAMYQEAGVAPTGTAMITQ